MELAQRLIGVAQQILKVTNRPVQAQANFQRAAGDGEVHLLICALDYKRTQNPLTCSMDGRNMQALANACGIRDVVAMYDEECTKERVFQAIHEVGGRCDEDDYFIFYYSGHGTSMHDEDGDEDDGKDEAFCFVDAAGQLSADTFMTDDEFATAVVEATSEEVRILILTDCCHSGTIADLDKDEWGNREAILVAGCLDSETSGDMGRGGIFTHSMLLAIDQLQDAHEDEYCVGMLYNACLENDNKIFHSAQNITIQASRSVAPERMAWPLIPRSDYQAPLTKAAAAAGGGTPSEEGMQQALGNPQLLQMLGIKPEMTQFINASGIQSGHIDPEKLVEAGVSLYLSGGCKRDNCVVQ